jgi:anti-sigma B factor antagonist
VSWIVICQPFHTVSIASARQPSYNSPAMTRRLSGGPDTDTGSPGRGPVLAGGSVTLSRGSEAGMVADPGQSRPRLSVAAEADGAAALRLVAVGEVDLCTAGQLRHALDAAFACASAVVVDLAGVNFLDSTGIGVLVHAYHTAAAAGGALSVANPQPFVRRVLEISGVLAVLTRPD